MFLIHDCQQSTNTEEQLNVLHESFDSFSLKNLSSLQLVSELTNFDISKKTINTIVSSMNISKSRGPNRLPPAFFRKTLTKHEALAKP